MLLSLMLLLLLLLLLSSCACLEERSGRENFETGNEENEGLNLIFILTDCRTTNLRSPVLHVH
jgi:hypothetical protein